MEKYARESERIMAILGDFTPLVEPLSLDEAFLDVTASHALHGPGVEIARRIKARIRSEVGLTASAGVAPNKFVAKIASDLEKPDGLVEVRPGQEAAFLRDLPLRRLWGVGPAAERELGALGARTIGDLARLGRARLEARLGASGAHLWSWPRASTRAPWSRGTIRSPSVPRRPSDTTRATSGASEPPSWPRRTGWRPSCERPLRGRTVTLKLRFADFRHAHPPRDRRDADR